MSGEFGVFGVISVSPCVFFVLLGKAPALKFFGHSGKFRVFRVILRMLYTLELAIVGTVGNFEGF